jgi:hypothetical protein
MREGMEQVITAAMSGFLFQMDIAKDIKPIRRVSDAALQKKK